MIMGMGRESAVGRFCIRFRPPVIEEGSADEAGESRQCPVQNWTGGALDLRLYSMYPDMANPWTWLSHPRSS